MIDLQAFIEFLTKDELISDFTGKVVANFNEVHKRLREQLKIETATAVQARDLFISQHPDDDDTNAVPKQIIDFNYDYSFAHFIRVLNESYRNHFHVTVSRWMTNLTSTF